MKKNKIVFCAFAVSGLILSACSQKAVNDSIDQKMAQETKINTQADLTAESARLIEAAPGITEAQRAQLITLRESSRVETQAQTKESLRLKAVLVKELLSPDYDRREVAVLQNKIKKAENKKLSILMDSIKKTNAILGRQAKRDLDDGNYDYIVHDFNFEQRDL